jgi:pyruvate dehydrogenase E1 component beta subunit
MTQAILEALTEEMDRDSRVFLMGEDVQLSIYGTSKGLVKRFGQERVRNTPISESAFAGAAIGAALAGARPVVDLMVGNFFYVAMDQIADQAAKLRYMTGGQCRIPAVWMSTAGATGSAAAQHSDSPYPLFMNVGGLKVVLPSTPADAKGLLKSAIRDDNPVIYFEPLSLMGAKGPVEEGDAALVPIGEARIARSGEDITLVAVGMTVPTAIQAADVLAAGGISVEVLDLRTLVPLDHERLFASVRKTGRLVVVDEARRSCGAAAEVAALVAEHAWEALRGPIRRVTAPDVPVPFSPPLEAAYLPSADRVVEAARSLLKAGAAVGER